MKAHEIFIFGTMLVGFVWFSSELWTIHNLRKTNAEQGIALKEECSQNGGAVWLKSNPDSKDIDFPRKVELGFCIRNEEKVFGFRFDGYDLVKDQ